MKTSLMGLCSLLLAAGHLGAQADVKGSSDHPMFPNRMPGYRITSYRQEGFAEYKFRTRPPTPIEGKYTRIHYLLNRGSEHPGGLAIRRNYENAVKAIGGEVVYTDKTVSVLKAVYKGKETWVELHAPLTSGAHLYFLYIVERQPMEQVITADAIGAAIDKEGFIALDIRFATGKADILPDSLPVVDKIADFMKKRPGMSALVEGHTDNTGAPALNKPLSDARAKSVVAALVGRGIESQRLFPVGYGQDQPVADNSTEEGRAKNRRVVIRKKQ